MSTLPIGSTACAPIVALCREPPMTLALRDEDDPVGDIEVLEALTFDVITDEPPFVFATDAPAICVTAPVQRTAPSERVTVDPFASFTRILEEVALAEGATPQAALFVRALLGETRTEGRALPAAVEQALVQGKLVTPGVRGLTRTPELCATVVAWQSLLRGETDEVSAASSTLDEWAADMVSRAIGDPHRAPSIRRELRARGVAAFGLVADAA